MSTLVINETTCSSCGRPIRDCKHPAVANDEIQDLKAELAAWQQYNSELRANVLTPMGLPGEYDNPHDCSDCPPDDNGLPLHLWPDGRDTAIRKPPALKPPTLMPHGLTQMGLPGEY